jgi:5-(carboxyamino)imidazole ribonucleotide synthase
MVGAGQLARMSHQAAIALDLDLRFLAARPDDGAARVSPHVDLGDPHDGDDLARFAAGCDVVTFDHELVDLDALARLETEGVVARPSAVALAHATDKAHQRRRLAAAGLPLPRHRITTDPTEAAHLGDEVGWPLVVKSARGGYDGRGVWITPDADAAATVVSELAARGTEAVCEAQVPLAAELAVVVVTDPTGAHVTYPTVETVQVDGICREILGPAPVDAEVRAEADGVARRVADVVGAVGVLAVELFWDGTRVLVNEVATRPHNSAHWTIEGAVTSQFANHLRAVAGLPLGRTDAVAPAVVCTNVLGAGHDPRTGLATALAVPGAAVHLYGKQARPGRKVGHVTVLGDDLTTARRRAAEAAAALGQPVPEVRR